MKLKHELFDKVTQLTCSCPHVLAVDYAFATLTKIVILKLNGGLGATMGLHGN
jgi:hypothetical protein